MSRCWSATIAARRVVTVYPHLPAYLNAPPETASKRDLTDSAVIEQSYSLRSEPNVRGLFVQSVCEVSAKFPHVEIHHRLPERHRRALPRRGTWPDWSAACELAFVLVIVCSRGSASAGASARSHWPRFCCSLQLCSHPAYPAAYEPGSEFVGARSSTWTRRLPRALRHNGRTRCTGAMWKTSTLPTTTARRSYARRRSSLPRRSRRHHHAPDRHHRKGRASEASYEPPSTRTRHDARCTRKWTRYGLIVAAQWWRRPLPRHRPRPPARSSTATRLMRERLSAFERRHSAADIQPRVVHSSARAQRGHAVPHRQHSQAARTRTRTRWRSAPTLRRCSACLRLGGARPCSTST